MCRQEEKPGHLGGLRKIQAATCLLQLEVELGHPYGSLRGQRCVPPRAGGREGACIAFLLLLLRGAEPGGRMWGPDPAPAPTLVLVSSSPTNTTAWFHHQPCWVLPGQLQH